MPQNMDAKSKYIIEDGHKIIDCIANETTFATESISEASAILERIIKETQGLLILDFLDASDWDCLTKVDCDVENNVLALYWHMPTTDLEFNKSRKMVFGWDIACVIMKFQYMEFVRDKNGKTIGIILQGYTFPSKEAQKYLSGKGINVVNQNEEGLYATEIWGKNNETISYVRAIKSPLYSFWIIPKSLAHLSPLYSSFLLYRHSINRIIQTTEYAYNKFIELSTDNTTLQREIRVREQRSKVNIIRQEAESLLKLIVCYYQQTTFGDDALSKITKYDHAEIGDLSNKVKKCLGDDEDIKKQVNEIARIANLYSHDSGNPIVVEDVNNLVSNIMALGSIFSQRLNR